MTRPLLAALVAEVQGRSCYNYRQQSPLGTGPHTEGVLLTEAERDALCAAAAAIDEVADKYQALVDGELREYGATSVTHVGRCARELSELRAVLAQLHTLRQRTT